MKKFITKNLAILSLFGMMLIPSFTTLPSFTPWNPAGEAELPPSDSEIKPLSDLGPFDDLN